MELAGGSSCTFVVYIHYRLTIFAVLVLIVELNGDIVKHVDQFSTFFFFNNQLIMLWDPSWGLRRDEPVS